MLNSSFCLMLCLLIVNFYACAPNGNKSTENLLNSKIDSLLTESTPHLFNGIVLVESEGEASYLKLQGFSDFENKTKLKLGNQFVIGSISKQITAALILLEWERGNLKLEATIGEYLPAITPTWKDSVTVHHLLAHTHGIVTRDGFLAFKPGEQFQYSQLGYQLLAEILEVMKGESFEQLSEAFFKQHGLSNTTHPKTKNYPSLVKGYSENENQKIEFEPNSFGNYVPAGGFVSTVEDLAKWNTLLYENQLLKEGTLALMSQKHATRQHPIWGTLDYGYGLTFKANENKILIGALGFAPGFVSSCFYLPKSKTSVVILENVAQNLHDFNEVFFFHLQILDLVKAHQTGQN